MFLSKTILKLKRSSVVAQLFFVLLFVVAQGQLLIHETDLEAHIDHSVCKDPIHFSGADSGILAEDGLLLSSSDPIKYSNTEYSDPVVASYYALQQPRAPPASSLS